MEDIKLFLPAGAFGFDVHALEQVGIALRVEDNHYLMFNAMNVLGDVHLSESRLADAGCAQHQRVTDPFAQWQTDLRLIGLDPMQQWRASYRW
ncbi:hypothetical protein PFLmoz3_00347 [Pseudomonas fluorescens]|uniref:Uncharacterized protein n=1 Tax=Pseudomonas fluorescens TaxID=294 RepID=A0A120G979_PSEFL|nr:hypothetical protein [Pseudomonas gessardii]KWV89999.1 hypothetical protein PFLmoz3_00347 [Pseudomonas fluorescens]